MKIAPPTDPAAVSAVTPSGSATGRPGGSDVGPSRTAPAAGAAAGQSATVQLSAAASRLQQASASPEFNAEKVQALRQAIEDGSFQVNAGMIADRLIGNARELLKHASH